MRLEKVLTAMTALTREQQYFLACWFNMVHEHSLDSYRVRVMNSMTALREVERVLKQGDKHHKLAVLSEAEGLIAGDPILFADPMAEAAKQLAALLKAHKSDIAEEKGGENALLMVKYFLAELKHQVDISYVATAFSQLEEILLHGSMAADPEDKRFQVLHQLCGNLLSVSIDRGFCLESLFQIYWQILVPRRIKPSYSFQRKFWLTQQILTQPKRAFRVTLAIDQVSKPQDLPSRVGSVDFSAEPPMVLRARHARLTYLDPMPTRIFASVEVDACDARAAGTLAFEQVNELFNLLRFEYERARIQMPDQFAFAEIGKEQDGARVYKIPMLVPNPSTTLDGAAVAEFVANVGDLMDGAPFSAEGRDRIYSAFRLYRFGRDTNVLENKLLNWWTAIEFLARGSQASGNIGSSVEAALTPVLCMAYLPKLLGAARNVLVEAGITLTDAHGNSIALRSLTLPELHAVFSDPHIQQLAHAGLATQPYVQEQLRLLFLDLAAQSFLTRLEGHETRLKWQLGRVYRARCDIVHSAGRSTNTSLLCSNLEYYLKVVLTALLRSVGEIPTLSGPREFFDRQNFTYKDLKIELRAGKLDALMESFSGKS